MSIILLSGCRESLEEQAARNCKEFTEKNCPTPVQLNIRMDSMVYENTTRTIRYYYTLSGPADNEKAVHKMQKELRSLLARRFIKTPDSTSDTPITPKNHPPQYCSTPLSGQKTIEP